MNAVDEDEEVWAARWPHVRTLERKFSDGDAGERVEAADGAQITGVTEEAITRLASTRGAL